MGTMYINKECGFILVSNSHILTMEINRNQYINFFFVFNSV
jgi:hypothetical protein